MKNVIMGFGYWLKYLHFLLVALCGCSLLLHQQCHGAQMAFSELTTEGFSNWCNISLITKKITIINIFQSHRLYGRADYNNHTIVFNSSIHRYLYTLQHMTSPTQVRSAIIYIKHNKKDIDIVDNFRKLNFYQL